MRKNSSRVSNSSEKYFAENNVYFLSLKEFLRYLAHILNILILVKNSSTLLFLYNLDLRIYDVYQSFKLQLLF